MNLIPEGYCYMRFEKQDLTHETLTIKSQPGEFRADGKLHTQTWFLIRSKNEIIDPLSTDNRTLGTFLEFSNAIERMDSEVSKLLAGGARLQRSYHEGLASE